MFNGRILENRKQVMELDVHVGQNGKVSPQLSHVNTMKIPVGVRPVQNRVGKSFKSGGVIASAAPLMHVK